MKNLKLIIVLLFVMLIFSACGGIESNSTNDAGKIKVVTTTTMLTDLAIQLGGDHVQVVGLMAPGVDPHYYKASAGDVKLLQEADVIVHNGLNLEGELSEVLAQLEKDGKIVVEMTKGIEPDSLLKEEESGAYDPHIWFDVLLWRDAAKTLLDGLIQADEENAQIYSDNYLEYSKQLEALDNYIRDQLAQIPSSSRVLITAHDAFAYFGRAYDFEVVGLQGISTVAEAGTADVRELADLIVEREVKAIFIESSVPEKNMKALQEAVQARGFNVAIGGELYSDSLADGSDDGDEFATYIETYKANIDTLVKALK